MATFSKLSWHKQLRGHHLSPAQYMVVMTVSSYTGKDGTHAHPGLDRICADTHLSRSTVKRALDTLTAGGYLLQTHTGKCRGDANVYALGNLTVAAGAPLRGSRVDPLTAGRGSFDPDKGFMGDPPSDHTHQVPNPMHGIIPNPMDSASPSGDADKWDGVRSDYDLFEEWLEEQLGGSLTAQEYSTAQAMHEGGMHPKAIVNTINKDRTYGSRSGTFDATQLANGLDLNRALEDTKESRRWVS